MSAIPDTVTQLQQDFAMYGYVVIGRDGHRVDPDELIFDPEGTAALDQAGQLYRPLHRDHQARPPH